MVKHTTFNTPHEIINELLHYSSMPHSDYESVKLYGDSEFILDILKCIFVDYEDISVVSIDIILNEIDPICKDLYVLSLTDDSEVFIQSGWNGSSLYKNEAKAVLCQDSKYSSIVNILDEDIPIIIFKNTQK